MKFLHLADIHLGCRRYQVDERTKDFFRAWHDVIVRHAIPEAVDFVLLAGDFFDRRNLDPQAMNHAMEGLRLLQDANIPVLAIEGNHDQHDAVSEYSWLRSLSSWGLLQLLEPVRNEAGNMALEPWDIESRTGSYIDIAGARIFGSDWYGASSNVAIPLLAEALRAARSDELFNILMLHTDVEGQLERSNIPALGLSTLTQLKPVIDYVALGHTHRRFEIDNWAMNPGSLEAVSIDEYRHERGAFLVEVGPNRTVHAALIQDYAQRPFQRLSFDVSGAVDAEAVFQGVEDVLTREARTYAVGDEGLAPVIEVTLTGQLGFKNSLLEIAKIRDEAKKSTGALHVILRNQSVPVEYAVPGADLDAPRHVRELHIVEELLYRNHQYRSQAPKMVELVVEAKRLALAREPAEKVLDLVRTMMAPDAASSPIGADTSTAAGRSAIERHVRSQNQE
ncbi:MAG: exonuclease SbcCD subunit D [Pyrinomonadaceae bacterium]